MHQRIDLAYMQISTPEKRLGLLDQSQSRPYPQKHTEICRRGSLKRRKESNMKNSGSKKMPAGKAKPKAAMPKGKGYSSKKK